MEEDSELVAVADTFQQLLEARDRDAIAELLDEDYALVLVHPQPAVMPRGRWLEVLPEYIVHEYRVEERIVDRDHETAAILQRVQMRATVLGEDRSGLMIISDVWRRRPGGWRLWRRHSTPLQAGRMPGA